MKRKWKRKEKEMKWNNRREKYVPWHYPLFKSQCPHWTPLDPNPLSPLSVTLSDSSSCTTQRRSSNFSHEKIVITLVEMIQKSQHIPWWKIEWIVRILPKLSQNLYSIFFPEKPVRESKYWPDILQIIVAFCFPKQF